MRPNPNDALTRSLALSMLKMCPSVSRRTFRPTHVTRAICAHAPKTPASRIAPRAASIPGATPTPMNPAPMPIHAPTATRRR